MINFTAGARAQTVIDRDVHYGKAKLAHKLHRLSVTFPMYLTLSLIMMHAAVAAATAAAARADIKTRRCSTSRYCNRRVSWAGQNKYADARRAVWKQAELRLGCII